MRLSSQPWMQNTYALVTLMMIYSCGHWDNATHIFCHISRTRNRRTLKFGTDMHLMMAQNVGEFESEFTFRSGDIAKKRKNRLDIGITPLHNFEDERIIPRLLE